MVSTKSQRDRFREKLVEMSPPREVLERFDKLCNVCEEHLFGDKLEDLLKDACRRENWTAPWEPNGVRLTFRAKKLDSSHPEFKHDGGGKNTPGEEQSYRRGFLQGFVTAKRKVDALAEAKILLEPLEREIWRWRTAELHDRNAIIWGDVVEPDYACKIPSMTRRSGLSPKKRFLVLERDNRRCVMCGVSANDGAVLEVDHIRPVARGGSDDLDNLQTLCFDCNRGKSDSYDRKT